jgi:hypothetical protein
LIAHYGCNRNHHHIRQRTAWSVLGINPNPRTFKGSEAGTNVTLGEGNYNVTAPEVSTFYWKDISPYCSGVINAGETKRCIITNSYANDIKTWTDEATNIKIQFSYLPLYPFVGNNTALNFKVTDSKTGVPLELAHVHVVIIKNVTANFTSSRTVSNKGDFVCLQLFVPNLTSWILCGVDINIGVSTLDQIY